MIKYPKTKNDLNKTSTLKDMLDTDMIEVGMRLFINKNPVTCVHIENNKYIFSMDEIYITGIFSGIESVLEEIYTTGKINDKIIFSLDILKEIDFLFIPTEKQVFGKNKCGKEEKSSIKQFDWFKNGNFTRVKGYYGNDSSMWNNGEVCVWWLATPKTGYRESYCFVNRNGELTYDGLYNDKIGIPIFFQITRRRNKV